jgi:ABC-type proline/glycine betaine transport system ATPase subunit
LALMRAGAVEQLGDAQSLMDNPANDFVANFFHTD